MDAKAGDDASGRLSGGSLLRLHLDQVAFPSFRVQILSVLKAKLRKSLRALVKEQMFRFNNAKIS